MKEFENKEPCFCSLCIEMGGGGTALLKVFARKLITAARESMPKETEYVNVSSTFGDTTYNSNTVRYGINVAREEAIAPLDEFLEEIKMDGVMEEVEKQVGQAVKRLGEL